jgi:hypothetical protein
MPMLLLQSQMNKLVSVSQIQASTGGSAGLLYGRKRAPLMSTYEQSGGILARFAS